MKSKGSTYLLIFQNTKYAIEQIDIIRKTKYKAEGKLVHFFPN